MEIAVKATVTRILVNVCLIETGTKEKKIGWRTLQSTLNFLTDEIHSENQ